MQITQKHLSHLTGYFKTLAESDEQPGAVKQSYTAAIATIEVMKDPTVSEVEAAIDSALTDARKCKNHPTFADAEKHFRHAEKATKFRIGIPMISADRWIEKPDLPPCVHGDGREWHIGGKVLDDEGEETTRQAPEGKTGTSYQNQLYCRKWEMFINPVGNVCEMCKGGYWPEIECWRNHTLPELIADKGVDYAQDVLVQAFMQKQLT